MADDSLTHFGVKGMRWGVIRERGANGRVMGSVAADHVTTRALMSKKQRELSTSELQKLNERLSLEKKNSELQSRGALAKIKKGTAIAGTILAAATTATAAYNLANSPAGKAAIVVGKRAYNKYVNHAIALGP